MKMILEIDTNMTDSEILSSVRKRRKELAEGTFHSEGLVAKIKPAEKPSKPSPKKPTPKGQ